MEKPNMSLEKEAAEKFTGYYIVEDDHEVTTYIDDGKGLVDCQAKLAIRNRETNEPYGETDAFIISNKLSGTIEFIDDGRDSIDIMADAIAQAVAGGKRSIAISADNPKEVNEVIDRLRDILTRTEDLDQIAIFYPSKYKIPEPDLA